MIPPGEDAEEPLALLLGVIVRAVACNVGYTLGWIGEIYFPLVIRGKRVWSFASGRFRPD